MFGPTGQLEAPKHPSTVKGLCLAHAWIWLGETKEWTKTDSKLKLKNCDFGREQKSSICSGTRWWGPGWLRVHTLLQSRVTPCLSLSSVKVGENFVDSNSFMHVSYGRLQNFFWRWSCCYNADTWNKGFGSRIQMLSEFVFPFVTPAVLVQCLNDSIINLGIDAFVTASGTVIGSVLCQKIYSNWCLAQ